MPRRYRSLICGSCDLRFAIDKKDYDMRHAYNCPMCLKANVITPEDLEPEKKVGRPKKIPPYFNPAIPEREV